MIPELYRLERNLDAVHGLYPAALRELMSEADHTRARNTIENWPDYSPTPLHEMAATAAELRIDKLCVKDEGPRFGLGAFKAIGGAYAVQRLIEQHDRQADITIACASAGNHGRAVAWGARRFGVRCVVYLYQGVSPGRVRAIEALGATVNLDAPDYDTAVREVARAAQANGWFIVSDTAYDGYTEIPRDVMQGYTLIAQEVVEELNGLRPTHVLLQAGVGGFAAAIAARFWQIFDDARPVFITVEPAGAACVLESIRHRRFTTLEQVSSIMGGLNCGVTSTVAWEILRRAADFAVAIPDTAILPVMRYLARPAFGDPPIVSGESGAAGIAALRWLAQDPDARAEIGLDQSSRVLAFVTEGATDPERYRELTQAALQA